MRTGGRGGGMNTTGTWAKRFMAALANEPNQDFREFVLVSLLCGGRRSNVEGMRWDDLDLQRGLWRIPEEQAKNREPMVVILPQQSVGLRRERRGRHGEPGCWGGEGGRPGGVYPPTRARQGWCMTR